MEDNLNQEYRNLILYIGKLIVDGIEFEGQKISFTMLDYYSITTDNIEDVLKIARKKRIRINNLENLYYIKFVKFAKYYGFLVRLVNDPNEVLAQKYSFIVDDEKYIPSREDIEEVFELFDANCIPKYNKLIYTALHRKALGVPVLPLLSQEKVKSM